MNRRNFGSTGIALSALGLGTVKLGRSEGVKYPQPFTIPDDQQAAQLIALARDLGINLIDTAPAYGNSEERLGHLLQGQRQHWVICSKVGEEFSQGVSSYDFSAAHTRLSIERSLQRLRTDFIDIVLVHSDGDDQRIIEHEDTLLELQKLKTAGLIRAFGVSTKTVAGGLLAAAHSDAVMVSYNLAYRDEQAVIDYCAAQRKGVLIKKAFASGHLYAQGEDLTQKTFECIFANAGVGSVIVGTINPQHLRANVAALERAMTALPAQ